MTTGYCNDFIHFASKSATCWFALASFYDRVCFGYLWKRSSFVCTKHYQCIQQNHTLDVGEYFFNLWVQVTTKSLKHTILFWSLCLPLKILKSYAITGHRSIHRISIHINNIQLGGKYNKLPVNLCNMTSLSSSVCSVTNIYVWDAATRDTPS